MTNKIESEIVHICDLKTFREQRGMLSVLEFQDCISLHSASSLKIYFQKHLVYSELIEPILVLVVKGIVHVTIVSDSLSGSTVYEYDVLPDRACIVEGNTQLKIESSHNAIFVLVHFSSTLNKTTCSAFLLDKLIELPVEENIVDITPFLVDKGFSVKRMFYVHNVPGTDIVRGKHMHESCSELLIGVSGSLDVLIDDGVNKEVYKLNSCDKGVLIPAGVWAEQFNFSDDALCLVLANEGYDEDRYWNSYEEFKKYKRYLK